LLTAGASHGFPPSRVLRPWPWSGFRPTPSLALRSCRNDLRHSPAPQSLDRPLLGLYRLRHLRTASPKATLLGFPHRLGPTHSDATPPGLSFSPRAGSHITAASPTVFRWWQRPTGVARIGLGAEASRRQQGTGGPAPPSFPRLPGIISGASPQPFSLPRAFPQQMSIPASSSSPSFHEF
jgi:hypothetical protein